MLSLPGRTTTVTKSTKNWRCYEQWIKLLKKGITQLTTGIQYSNT